MSSIYVNSNAWVSQLRKIPDDVRSFPIYFLPFLGGEGCYLAVSTIFMLSSSTSEVSPLLRQA